ncbi:MAG: L-2,4-diaminobutyrate decarboxylase [Paraglaciecola sp.]|jgi:L-2,4-diaminobutyrate decarboxylase
MTPLLKEAYNPETFRQQGYNLVNILADYLKDIQTKNTSTKVLNWNEPADLVKKWQADLATAPNPNIDEFFKEVIKDMAHIHHPKYLGHQVSAALPLAALGDFFGAFLDTGMGIYEQGTAGVAMERILIQLLASKMNIDIEKADGFLTNGGTLGNLTALLCARAKMIEREVWQHGFEGRKYAFLVSEEAHYSIDKAIRVMGMGATGLIKVPSNDAFQIDVSKLENILQQTENQGIKVIGVIGNACSTSAGAHDDLNAIADFCEVKKLWFHVDAAHGGGLLFSKKYRPLLNGIERADSVILDFHKMLMMPTLVTAVVFKNGEDSYQTFAQKADYLWSNSDDHEWYNLAKRTFELTKTSMSFRVFLTLRTYGEQLFEDNLDCLYDLAKTFAEMLAENPNFKLGVAIPESNIVCFRVIKEGLSEEALDNLNAKIREQILKEGDFFIVQTRLRGRLFLRTTFVNPLATKNILSELIQKCEKFLE